MHLDRNSCDHGIEPPDVRQRAGKTPQGKLTLRAYHEGGQVNIEISDDGAGLNLAKIVEKATQKGLITSDQGAALLRGEKAPDGNQVSLDQQMERVAQTDSQHEAVSALYMKYLGMFRTALGK